MDAHPDSEEIAISASKMPERFNPQFFSIIFPLDSIFSYFIDWHGNETVLMQAMARLACMTTQGVTDYDEMARAP
ncbi:hypothetical protein [Actimicrobium sp. GrIS 1.19]|uniref:hypothetical protein n=1 Tax=Actimicrobium sp. GrIS 1.19 TaxID=3071708 RepID=UPI002E1294C0